MLISLIGSSSHAQDHNYCHDKKSWQEWDELIRKNYHDMDIQFLHAVRIGFCEKIEAGTIEFDTAREIFNALHEKVLEKAQKEKQRMLENSEL